MRFNFGIFFSGLTRQFSIFLTFTYFILFFLFLAGSVFIFIDLLFLEILFFLNKTLFIYLFLLKFNLFFFFSIIFTIFIKKFIFIFYFLSYYFSIFKFFYKIDLTNFFFLTNLLFSFLKYKYFLHFNNNSLVDLTYLKYIETLYHYDIDIFFRKVKSLQSKGFSFMHEFFETNIPRLKKALFIFSIRWLRIYELHALFVAFPSSPMITIICFIAFNLVMIMSMADYFNDPNIEDGEDPEVFPINFDEDSMFVNKEEVESVLEEKQSNNLNFFQINDLDSGWNFILTVVDGFFRFFLTLMPESLKNLFSFQDTTQAIEDIKSDIRSFLLYLIAFILVFFKLFFLQYIKPMFSTVENIICLISFLIFLLVLWKLQLIYLILVKI